MTRGRVMAMLLAAAMAAVGLVACGGGGSGTSTPAASVATTPVTTATPATTATATTPATTASTPATAAKPAETVPHPSTTTAPSGSGGGAASFRAPRGDNSIPDYGSEAPPTERERAGAALAAFLRARAKGEWSTACTYLAATTRTQLERLLGRAQAKLGGCARVLAEFSKSSVAAHAETPIADVVALRIKGNSAFVLFHGAKGSRYVMPMRNEGGAWKMSQLAPLPYPLGSAGATP